MPDFQPIIIAPGGDTVRVGFQKASDNATNQFAGWIGPTKPSNAVDGTRWLLNGNPARLIEQMQENGVDKNLLTFHRLEENLDGSGHQFVGLIPERVATGGIVTPSASAAGTIQYDQTRGILVYVTATQQLDLVAVDPVGSTLRLDTRLTTAARTNPGVANTATEYGGYLLSAGSNEITAIALSPLPDGWGAVATANQKIVLEIDILLAIAQSTNDEVGFTGTLYADEAGSAIGARSVALPSSTLNIQTATAQYTRHRLEISFGPGDFNSNPLVGDVFRASLALDTAKAVSSAICTGVNLRISAASPFTI